MGCTASKQASIPAAETVWRAGPAPLEQRSCGAAAVPPAGPPSSLAAAHGSEGQHSEQASLAGGEAAACSAPTCCQAPSAPPGGHQLAVGGATVTLPENNGPWDEAARLASLHELRVLGRPPDARFSSIVRLVKSIFGVSVAVVSLVDAQELNCWSKASDGAFPEKLPRRGTFCDWIFVSPTPSMIIFEDLTRDVRFRDSPFVADGLRFYAGSPLLATDSAHRYGTLCIIDTQPRHFTAEQYAILAHFAEIVTRELERDKVARWQAEQVRLARLHPFLIRALDCFQEGVVLCDPTRPDWPILYSNDAWRTACGMGQAAPLDALSFWTLFDPAPCCQEGQEGQAEQGSSAQALRRPPAAPGQSPWDPAAPTLLCTREEVVAAAAELQPFCMRVLPRAKGSSRGGGNSSSTGSDVGGDSLDGGSASRTPTLGSSPAPILVHFKPSGTDEQLRRDAPSVGIPSFVELGAGDNIAPALLPSGPSAPAQSAADHRPPAQYYFGVVQPEGEAAASGLGSPRSPLHPLASGGISSCSGGGGGARLGSHMSSGVASSRDSLSSACSLPAAFYQMRPQVFQEVCLGPLIGTGSNGRCYRGTWEGGHVVVKIMDSFVREQDEAALSDVRCAKGAVLEALLSRSLSHPHIVPTYDYAISTEEPSREGSVRAGRRHQQVWLVQAYCNRGSLMDAIDRGDLRCMDNSANLVAILRTAQEVAGALLYLHGRGVLHGDLSANNILLSSSAKDERGWIAQVGDFGLSRVLHGSSISTRSYGTVTHMPPELLLDGLLSPATDIYSFGVILHEMWTGQRAFRGLNAVQIMHGVTTRSLALGAPQGAPPAYQDLVLRCVQGDHLLRPDFGQVLGELTRQLEEVLALPGGSSRGRDSARGAMAARSAC